MLVSRSTPVCDRATGGLHFYSPHRCSVAAVKRHFAEFARVHIDPQGQFYDRHAQPIAKEAALGHALGSSHHRSHVGAVNEVLVHPPVRTKVRIVDKVSRFKLHLKNPHFSERKRGCAESAAQHSAVQAGRRPPRERREAALTALGGRRGTGARRSPLRFVVRSWESEDGKRDFLLIRDKHSHRDPDEESSRADEQSSP